MGVTIDLTFTGLCLFRARSPRIASGRLDAGSVFVYLPETRHLCPDHVHTPYLGFPVNCWVDGEDSIDASQIETVPGEDGVPMGLVVLDYESLRLPLLLPGNDVTMSWHEVESGDAPTGPIPTPSLGNASWVVDLGDLVDDPRINSACDDTPLKRPKEPSAKEPSAKEPSAEDPSDRVLVVARIELSSGALRTRRVARKIGSLGDIRYPALEMRDSLDSETVWSQALAEEVGFEAQCDRDTCELELVRASADGSTTSRKIYLEARAGGPNVLPLTISHLPPHPVLPADGETLQTHFKHLYDLLEAPPTERPCPVQPGILDLPANSLCPPGMILG